MSLSSTEGGSSPVVRDLRIVLLGKTGSGKSATGNTILGRVTFTTEVSPSSVTKTCKKEMFHFDERTVSVVDTPGVFDTSIDGDELKSEMQKCIMLSLPGPHIFLLVVRLNLRFTEEEKNAATWIKDNFGEEASSYTVVVFTRGDELQGMSIETYLNRSPELRKFISDSTAGYVVFDNTCMKNRTQVADLFEKIDKMVQLNGGNHYTSSMYEEAQKKKDWEEKKIRWGGYLKNAGLVVVGASGGALAVAMGPEAVLTGAVTVMSSAIRR